ncbi:hypothetical protein [Deinococcus sp.]|uniref:hypothetical protein n=1 Tax=Deinococcus sp. TaxID=47478 RepID=UPI003CC699F7
MIDSLLLRLRRSGERVQRRGEEVAQSARLRLDIFQLGRELDTLYARLGRAYHGSATVGVLEEIRADIKRVEDEIVARERLMNELTTAQTAPTETTTLQTVALQVTGTPPASQSVPPVQPAASSFQAPASQISSSQPPSALSVWREKEAARMTDPASQPELIHGPATDATGRPDGENADPTRTTGGDPRHNPLTRHQDAPTEPHESGQGDKLQPTSHTASMGNEAARDEMVRHQGLLKEGEMATRDPDPLASKD